jgi:hypothetical protein
MAIDALAAQRRQCAAGEEAQVDFGTGAPIVGPDGRRISTGSLSSGKSLASPGEKHSQSAAAKAWSSIGR